MTRRSLGLLFGLTLCLAVPALASTITITSSATPTMTLKPSNDAIRLQAGSAALSSPGNVVFQNATIDIGDSEIPDQVIPFYFTDIITINGISHSVAFSGQDSVTSTADLITFSSGGPVNFGAYTFTPDNFSFNATAFGQTSLSLSGEITDSPVPEPATLPLFATGLMGGAMVAIRRKRRSACHP